MSLFNQMGQTQPLNPMQAIQQIQSNPAGMLCQAGYNIPAGMNNPQQIVSYLLQTGQVQQGRINQLMNMAGQFGRR